MYVISTTAIVIFIILIIVVACKKSKKHLVTRAQDEECHEEMNIYDEVKVNTNYSQGKNMLIMQKLNNDISTRETSSAAKPGDEGCLSTLVAYDEPMASKQSTKLAPKPAATLLPMPSAKSKPKPPLKMPTKHCQSINRF